MVVSNSDDCCEGQVKNSWLSSPDSVTHVLSFGTYETEFELADTGVDRDVVDASADGNFQGMGSGQLHAVVVRELRHGGGRRGVWGGRGGGSFLTDYP